MIIFAEMLVHHVDGIIDLPEDLEEYEPEQFPHWHVYRLFHQGCAIHWESLQSNAKIIASIPVERLKTMLVEDFVNEGVHLVL